MKQRFITISWNALPVWIRHPILCIAERMIKRKLRISVLRYIKLDPPCERKRWKIYPPTAEDSIFGEHCGYVVWHGHVWAYGYPKSRQIDAVWEGENQ